MPKNEALEKMRKECPSSEPGELSKEEAIVCETIVMEMFDALPKTRRLEHLGSINELLVFIGYVKATLPTRAELAATKVVKP